VSSITRDGNPTTLMKLTTRGTAAVEGCNEALLATAAQASCYAPHDCAQAPP
jgi:hypothetical protein